MCMYVPVAINHIVFKKNLLCLLQLYTPVSITTLQFPLCSLMVLVSVIVMVVVVVVE